jgi:hypothetical protein
LALVGLRTTRLVTQECTRFLGRRDSAYANYTSGSLCGRAVADYAHTWPLLRVPPNQHRVGPLCQLEVSRDTKTSTGFVDPIPYSFAFGPPARVGSIRVCRKRRVVVTLGFGRRVAHAINSSAIFGWCLVWVASHTTVSLKPWCVPRCCGVPPPSPAAVPSAHGTLVWSFAMRGKGATVCNRSYFVLYLCVHQSGYGEGMAAGTPPAESPKNMCPR